MAATLPSVLVMQTRCGGTAGHTQAFPTQDRDSGAMCAMMRLPGITDAGVTADAAVPGVECNVDSDCTQGKNGRCGIPPGPDRLQRRCTYDACFSDSDCASNQACLCSVANTVASGNECLPANCRSDADCNGLGCSPTLDMGCGSGGVQGLYCHTPSDQCVNDGDCAQRPGSYCAYQPAAGYWACSPGNGAPGGCAG